MNYSCIHDVGYFDSPEFLSLALHVNTGISTPIHLFGFYCILLKTTKQMKSAKWYLVNVHVWVVLFDYSFSILTIPFLLLPSFAGHPLGILRYFGVSTLFQIVLVLVFLAKMIVSISMVFENRFYILCTFPGKSHWKHWRKVWVVLFHVSGCACFISYYFFVPNQEVAKRNMYQLHKAFMIALGTQVTVPFALLAFPGIYLWMALINDYYHQAYTNISVTMMSMHGFISSIVMILAHRPYRTALFDTVKRKRKVSSRALEKRNAISS